MKLKLSTFAVLLATPVAVILAQDIQFPQPESGYSGIRTIQVAGNTVEATVNSEGPKERSEMSLQGQTMTSIVRQDLEVIWMLMPGNSYMELPMNSSGPGPVAPPPSLNDNSSIVEFVEEGPDQVNGFDTTRFRFVAENPDGSNLEGLIWLTDQNIAIRTSMTVEVQGRRDEVTVELRNLEVGDQPDSLFEIPNGYQKLTMPNMPGLNPFGP